MAQEKTKQAAKPEKLHKRQRKPQLKCPQCGSKSLYKDGLRYLANGETIQRWLCRNCSYRFTPRNRCKKPSEPLKNVHAGQ